MKKTTDSFKRKPPTSSLTQKPQKPTSFQSTLTKKLSLALDEKFPEKNIDDEVFDNDEKKENDEISNSSNTFEKERKQSAVLEKAKALIEKSKSMKPTPTLKYKTVIPKDDAFLTAIHVTSENLIKPQSNPQEFEPEPEELNEDEMLKNLWLDNNSEHDDLAELRKMINKTKKNISDYASGLYNLKNYVNDVKSAYSDMGYKIKNNDLMYEMDKVLDEYVPGGDKNSMFTYEFYDDPSRNKQKPAIPNQKKLDSSKKKHAKRSSLIK